MTTIGLAVALLTTWAIVFSINKFRYSNRISRRRGEELGLPEFISELDFEDQQDMRQLLAEMLRSTKLEYPDLIPRLKRAVRDYKRGRVSVSDYEMIKVFLDRHLLMHADRRPRRR